jgi:hypothetical protein
MFLEIKMPLIRKCVKVIFAKKEKRKKKEKDTKVPTTLHGDLGVRICA